MKYTRYNLKSKPKSSNNPLFYLAIVLLLALLFATVIVTVLKKSGNPILEDFFNISLPSIDEINGNNGEEGAYNQIEGMEQPSKEEGNKGNTESVDSINGEFFLLQCGAFKVKENANKIIGELKLVGTPFIIEEGELYKVYSGIYTKDKIDAVYNSLKSSGIENSKVIIAIDTKEVAGSQLSKCIESLLQIVDKFTENTVISIETKELKGWASELESFEDKSDLQKDAIFIKEYINNLSETVDKNQANDILSTIGKIIIKYKK